MNIKNPAELKNWGPPHRKVWEVFYLHHPVPEPRAAQHLGGGEGAGLLGGFLSDEEKGHRRTLARLIAVDIYSLCYQVLQVFSKAGPSWRSCPICCLYSLGEGFSLWVWVAAASPPDWSHCGEPQIPRPLSLESCTLLHLRHQCHCCSRCPCVPGSRHCSCFHAPDPGPQMCCRSAWQHTWWGTKKNPTG